MSADDSKGKPQGKLKGSREEHQTNDELAVKAKGSSDEEPKTSPEEDETDEMVTGQSKGIFVTDDPSTGVPTPAPKPEAALTFKELAKKDDEISVLSEEEIPDFLYAPSTRSNDAAKIMVFEGIMDTKTIHKRTGLTAKTITNIRSEVRKLAENVVKAQEQEEGKPTGKGRARAKGQ